MLPNKASDQTRADAPVTSFQIRKRLASESSVISGGEQMTSRAEVRSDDPVHLDKSLRVPAGFEPPHSPLSLTRRLMGILRPVVQVTMLSMSDAGHHHPFRCAVAAELISNNDARLSRPVARNSLRKNRIAANRSRRGCTRMSRTTPF